MHKIGWYIAKVKCKFKKSYEPLSEYYRAGGAKIGYNCCICSDLDECNKEMINIGNDCTISTQVCFVTHDHSIFHVRHKWGDLWGRIIIGNNCFIGERSVIMYGVKLADNTIVAAGSVVTKSFTEGGIIIGGNPAKKIGTCDDFLKKYGDNHFDGKKDFLRALENDDDERFIKRREY